MWKEELSFGFYLFIVMFSFVLYLFSLNFFLFSSKRDLDSAFVYFHGFGYTSIPVLLL